MVKKKLMSEGQMSERNKVCLLFVCMYVCRTYLYKVYNGGGWNSTYGDEVRVSNGREWTNIYGGASLEGAREVYVLGI
jgi:hypothetical protein